MFLVGTRVPEATIRDWIRNAGPFGPLLFIFLIWLTNICAPLSASPFLFAGFYLFGQMIVFYAFVAAIVASISNFWIAKIWGRSIVEKLAGKDSLGKVDKLADNYGYPSLFIFRVFLVQFHDVISYFFGLTDMKFTNYFTISTLGLIPGTLILYFISTQTHNPLSFTILNLVIACVSLSTYILIVKLKNKRKLQKEIESKKSS